MNSTQPEIQQGQIIAGYGRHYLAETAPGVLLQVFARGKHSLVAVGDQVALCAEAVGQASIQSILPRRNLLYRSDAFKSKLLAANIDQVIIVLATEPSFSEDLLARSLIAAHAAEITPLVLLNKTDLQKNFSAATVRLQPYRTLGYTFLALCAQQQITTELLKPYLLGKTSILIGQSGMGKSTLLNLLVPDAAAHTREISEKLDSGKHTTTATRLYHLPTGWQGGALVDAPGFQEFGLHHLSEGMLERAFPDFQPFLGKCKFYNCHHLQEPGCAILAAVQAGHILPKRQLLYEQLVLESRRRKPYRN